MSHYRSGADLERATRHALEADGYDVIRSAGSKGKVDLLAFKPGQILAVQCKTNGLCPPAERTELIRLARILGALPIVAAKPVGTYRLLTGSGPKEWVAWTPDEVAA